MVNGQSYPMHPVAMLHDRWEGLVPVAPNENTVKYRFKFDYLYNNFGTQPKPNSEYSKVYTLHVLDQYAEGGPSLNFYQRGLDCPRFWFSKTLTTSGTQDEDLLIGAVHFDTRRFHIGILAQGLMNDTAASSASLARAPPRRPSV